MAKTQGKTEDDELLELLEMDIAKQLEMDFDPDSLSSDVQDEEPAPKKEDVESLNGKTVSFYSSDDEETVVGIVTKHTKKTLTVDAGEYEYKIRPEEATVVDGSEEEGDGEEGSPAGSEEAEVVVQEEEVEEEVSGDTGKETDREEVMIDIDSVKIPKKLVRQFRKGESWNAFLTDLKTGQNDAIEVNSPHAKKPILVDGLRRLMGMREIGAKQIRVRRPRSSVRTLVDRLSYALKANINREGMMWIDTARTFAILSKEGVSNRKISKDFGISESKVSRMVNASRLPKKILEFAEDPKSPYSESVFMALASCDKKTLNDIHAVMEKGSVVTVSDIKALVKERAKEEENASEEESNDPTGPTSITLGKDKLGKMLSVKVKEGTVSVHLKIDWPKKTFRTFDPISLLSAAFEEAFEDDATTIESYAGLIKAMKQAKAEIG